MLTEVHQKDFELFVSVPPPSPVSSSSAFSHLEFWVFKIAVCEVKKSGATASVNTCIN